MGNYQNTRHHKGPRELVTGGEWIYGRNPVEEALAAARRTASEIVLPPAFPNEDDQIARIRAEAQSRRLMIRTMDRDQLDRLTRFGHHQGVALKTTGYPYVGIEDIIHAAEDDENALVIVLDHLEDPQNVGAILRTAAAVGATGVVIPEDRACGITPAAVRASAGGTEHVIEEVERAINDAIRTVGITLEDGKVVAGAGAPEIEIELKLAKYASSVGGREQLAIEAFAKAMEIIGETENRFSGIPIIRRQMSEFRLPAPVFESRRGSFKVTMFNGQETSESKNDNSLSRQILDYCSVWRTRADLKEHFGQLTSSYLMSYFVNPLVAQGKIVLRFPEKPRSKKQEYRAV